MGVSGNVRIGEVEAEGLGIVNDGHGEAVAVASAEVAAAICTSIQSQTAHHRDRVSSSVQRH